ncbi:hypothetical protein VitviT2T_021963 [Vitis vinifera]|uniref:Tetraspanin-8 n=1 Tax=Vitis vinifera TaxID=29760 RepID=A0ABY9DAV6_VITVI|nr:hypothetical protein VitviT2T_021963 [Vitis vinifera]
MLASMGVHKSSYKGEPAETIHLRQFSDWLQLNVVDKEDWNAIRSCLSETLFCEGEKQPGAVKGCCKPPAYCGYELKNGTTWTVPKSGLRSKDHDCVTWSNDPRIMCYDCDSCKAGFLARIKNNWRKLSAFFSCLIAFLVINFVIGCCAFRVVEVHSGMRKGVSGESPRLQQFSDWLQMNVVDRQNWLGIKACLSETKICSSPEISPPARGLYRPIKNGCCKPPAHCGYKLKNGTVWTVPSSGLASRDHDCIMWSSEPNTLCYDCESCKAGVLSRIQEDWWRLSIVACCLIAFLVINFMVGCCAFRSTRAFDKYQRCGYQS